jgi:NAD(P)-dependent dehydrogenase (short-subunit alcohol dehydrogenase family)
MSLDLRDKKILITGSSDGLGKALAVEFSKLGAR